MAELPKRPRLRLSLWFEGDKPQAEMLLMDENRNRVHSQRYAVNEGDTMHKLHQVLLTIAGQSAAAAGVVNMPPGAAGAAAAATAAPAPKPPAPSSAGLQPAPSGQASPTTKPKQPVTLKPVDEGSSSPDTKPPPGAKPKATPPKR